MKYFVPNILKNVFFLAIILMMLVSLIPTQIIRAESSARIESLKENIQTRSEEIRNLETEIIQYQKQLETIGGEKKTLQSTVLTLDTTRSKLSKDIQLTSKKIDRTALEISQLGLEIAQRELKIAENRESIANIVRRIDEKDHENMIAVLLSSDSIASFLGESDELASLQTGIMDMTRATMRLRDELRGTKVTMEKQKKELSVFNSQIQDQKQIADQQRKEQAQLLAQTKNKESEYKKLLADKLARKKQFEREIDDYEAQLRAEIDPTSFPTPGTRVFSYPVVNPFITQKFGKTVDARRLYASGSHNGIDFRASRGTPITAVADGIVVGTGDTDTACRWASYGKWILIRHHNGLATIYGHLDLIKANEGQSVSAGDLIGYSGNTGYSTGPHLHFTTLVASAVEVKNLPSKSCAGAVFRIPVAAVNAYLDPETYF